MELDDEECRALKHAIMRELARPGPGQARHDLLRGVLGKLAQRLEYGREPRAEPGRRRVLQRLERR